MKKQLVYLLVWIALPMVAQTGIGTAAPVNKLQVETTLADPATTGATANGNLRLSGTTGSHVLDFGLSSVATYSWLQARSKLAYGTTYNLVLNPNGGNVGIGTTSPTAKLNLSGGGFRIFNGFGNNVSRPALNTSTIGNYEIRGVGAGGGSTQADGADDGFLRVSAGGGNSSNTQSSIDLTGYSSVADMSSNIVLRTAGTERMRIDNAGKVGLGTTTPGTSLHIENGNTFGTDPSITTSPSVYIFNNNNTSTSAHSSLAIRTNGNGGGNPYLSFDIGGVRGYSMGIDNADGDKFKFQNNWNLNTSVTPALTITADNKVGIGTTSPSYPLHVATSVSQYVNVYGYLSQTNAQGSYTANTNVFYSIQADQRIRAPEFNAISDARIKKGITQLNTQSQLADLNKLKVKNYSYIDQLANGNKNKTGFIAQEVEQVNTQFVNQSPDFVPSVFVLAKSVSLENDKLKITLEKPHGFAKGDEVKFFAEGKKEVIKTIDEVSSPDSFSVKEWNEPTNNLFVYGKKVADFRAIDFDQITALSVAAIQELSKQVETLNRENTRLNQVITKGIQEQNVKLKKQQLQIEFMMKRLELVEAKK